MNLAGYLHFDSGAPVASANVDYYAAVAGTPTTSLGSTTTNTSGYWEFTGVTAGRYDVRIRWDSNARVRWLKGLATDSVTEVTVTTLRILDTSRDHVYTIGVSELAADRTITIPLLTGNDVFVFADFIQTLTNKTLTSPVVNTQLTGTAVGTGASQVAVGNHQHSEYIPHDPDRVIAGSPAAAAATNRGDHPAGSMTDGAKTSSNYSGRLSATPTAVYIAVVSGGDGNIAWYTLTDWAAQNQNYNQESDSQGSDVAPQTTAINLDQVDLVDITGSFTNATAGDYFGLQFIRDGDDAVDTVNAVVYVLGLYIVY